jgi:hypothetical protein
MAALALMLVGFALPATAASADTGPPVIYTTSRHAGTKAGGTEVWIYGLDIDTATSVRFGDTVAPSWYFSFGTINVTTPAHAVGDVPIIVETPAGTTSTTMVPTNTYTFTEPGVPVIANMSPVPQEGPEIGTTIVDLYGYDMDGATGVRFGETPAASIFSIAPTQIRVTAPAHLPGVVHVTIDKPVGSSPPTVESTFTFYPQPPPTLNFVSPRSIPVSGGSIVSIVGVGFTNATRVQFGANRDATSFSIYDDQHILAIAPAIPAAQAGYVVVYVTTPKGTTINTSAAYLAYVAPPSVTSLAPRRGSTAGGDQITLTGARLASAFRVEIDGVQASFTVNSGTELVVTTPAHAAGSGQVKVWTPNGTSVTNLSTIYTYDTPGAPVVTATSPTSGPTAGGTAVTLTGTGFTGTTAVTVGGAPAAFTVVSSTQIMLTTPARPTTGLVNIQVRRNLATSSASPWSWYTYR